jgi:hypothetical protein
MIPFANFAPDQPPVDSTVTGFVDNVVPRTVQSYGPIKALSTTGDALTARCQGARSFRSPAGVIETFAGDAGKLYRWNGTTWVDVSKVGGYSTPTEGRWTFEQFGNFIYAANGVDILQTWTLGSSSVFADAAGAPIGRYLAAGKDFLFVGHLSAATQDVQWSSQFDSTTWVGNQADAQPFPNNGRITGLVAWGFYVTVFQEHGIHFGQYVGPDSGIFQFDQVSIELGCIIPGSIATVEQTSIFVGKDGFYRIDGGQAISPIGDGTVDEYFWDNVNQDFLYRVWSAFDVRRKYYYVTFPTTLSSDGTPDRTLVYNLKNGRWSQQSAIGYDVLFQMFSDLSIDLDTDIDVADQDLDGPGLPSLDSEIFFGSNVPKLAAFNSAKLVGFFSGANLEALIDTVEARLFAGLRSFISRVRGIIDGGIHSIALVTRNRPNDTATVGTFVTQNNSGECNFRVSAKQVRARVKIAAGSSWSHAQGVEFDALPEGDR